MEHYIFSCGNCKARYIYMGFKTGIGKTQLQLEQVRHVANVCGKCGHDKRDSTPTRQGD